MFIDIQYMNNEHINANIKHLMKKLNAESHIGRRK